MQRATFKSIKLDDPSIFAIQVAGHLGTRQKDAVESLCVKCRTNGKQKIIFEFSELASLGGAIANVLGDFARELQDGGYSPQFVGATHVVQSFLTGRFQGVDPSFVETMEEAVELLSREPVMAPEGDDVVEAILNEMPNVEEDVSPEPDKAESAEPPSTSSGSIPTASMDPSGRRYFSLEEAEQWLAEAKNPAEKKLAFSGLLFGADLAESCFLFHRFQDKYVETEDTSLSIPVDGALAKLILDRRGPVPIVDLSDTELVAQESDMLSTLNCQMAIPLLDGDELSGVLFLRKRLAGQEYEPGEALALDLLARYLADSTGRAAGSKASSARREREGNRELKEKIYRNQTLARVSQDLNSIQDEEQLLDILLVTLISELGAGCVAYYDLVDGRFIPRRAKGVELTELSAIAAPTAKRLESWEQVLIYGRGGGSKELQAVVKELAAADLSMVAPLRAGGRLLGAMAMGRFRAGDSSGIDLEYLRSLLRHAGVAVLNTQAFRGLHEQTMRVARTLMSLAAGRDEEDMERDAERTTHYVSAVARMMNFPPEDTLDFIYGTVLHDIGMIEISDLLLRSPSKLTPAEWKLVQRHPVRGAEILRDLDFGEKTCEVVMHHHERFNGEGYPNGLKGNAIPLGARILAVVESYQAMVRDLPYRAALSRDEAIEVLRENWEMRYDPEVVQAFAQVLATEPHRADVEETVARS